MSEELEIEAVVHPFSVGRSGHDSTVAVIPAEICRRLNVKPGRTRLLVSVDASGRIVLQPMNQTIERSED